MRPRISCLVGLLLAVSSTNIGRSEELPLWEMGLGAAALSLPDYRGSDQQRLYVLPLPYLVYRGDLLRMDSEGITGLLFRSERVRLKLSGEATMPTKSDKNRARRGMPDLDLTFQVGPALEICLARDTQSEREVLFRLPVRAVIATDLSTWKAIGFVVNPQLTLALRNIGPGAGLDLRGTAGTYFASERYHDYYYEVAPEHAIPDSRPAYDARGGYSGAFLMLTTTKRFRHMWLGSFVSYDNLAGAVFEDSPLMRTRHVWMAGLGLSWVFAESKKLVQAQP
ncbi:MAG: MipA/OmpV family protein [Deferrisomatales bacterium]|nr:MipA/OmpV family protein [Deferrisomatales bacterium]